MKQYTKKPITVEAIQWDGTKEMAQQLLLIPGLNGLVVPEQEGFRFRINTLEGRMTVSPGDFIIKGVQGEYYPCKPDIFHQTYEKLEEAETREKSVQEKAPTLSEEDSPVAEQVVDKKNKRKSSESAPKSEE